MTVETRKSNHPRVRAEDICLTVLGLMAGPLLWWIGNGWQTRTATSSLQALEYWIGFICAMIGLALSVLWLLFLLSSFGMVLGLKTRNRVLAYWSERFTPTFLRRIIIATFGAQLALSSQAFAGEVETPSPSPTAAIEEPEPFMPHVVSDEPSQEPIESSVSPTSPTESPSVQPRPSATDDVSTPEVPVPAEPRQHSEISVGSPSPSPSASSSIDPTPRQTTTIEVDQYDAPTFSAAEPDQSSEEATYVPQQPVPTPTLSVPRHGISDNEHSVVVRRGDCLWDIAHHELGADATLVQIDQRWRQWWIHNQDILGDNPHQLTPGTILHAPPFTD